MVQCSVVQVVSYLHLLYVFVTFVHLLYFILVITEVGFVPQSGRRLGSCVNP